MPGAAQQTPPPLSVKAFRAWAETRPDEEHWELVGGVPMMMAPPTRDHQRIASNLERLLQDALQRQRPQRAAYQRIGVNVGIANYDPEPDVTVVDFAMASDARYADRFYLAAEVVSESDRPTVEAKREIYRAHPHCNCILVVRQDRMEATVDLRAHGEWTRQTLSGPADMLVLSEFGLRCQLAELYRGTVGPR
jgi:Uma2 family endonuclease